MTKETYTEATQILDEISGLKRTIQYLDIKDIGSNDYNIKFCNRNIVLESVGVCLNENSVEGSYVRLLFSTRKKDLEKRLKDLEEQLEKL